jgi:hypothetical protein
MSGTTIEKAALTKAALALYDEGYAGPADSKGTWFVDNEPDCGFLGTIGKLSAAQASRPASTGESLTIASHAAHLRYSLSLANRAAKGENPYASADWAASWATRSVSEEEWSSLVSGLRAEYAAFREALAKGGLWDADDLMTGTLGLLCHGAWHLGAIRQALGLVKAPESR